MAKRLTPLIYVDSSVLLDLITDEKTLVPETEVPRGVAAEHILQGIEEGKARFATSALVEIEVYTTPMVRSNNLVGRVQEALAARFSHRETVWCDIDRIVAQHALEVAGKIGPPYKSGKKIKSADVGHLAAAVRARCDYFMTTDGGFPINTTIDNTKIRFPHPVVWEPELF